MRQILRQIMLHLRHGPLDPVRYPPIMLDLDHQSAIMRDQNHRRLRLLPQPFVEGGRQAHRPRHDGGSVDLLGRQAFGSQKRHAQGACGGAEQLGVFDGVGGGVGAVEKEAREVFVCCGVLERRRRLGVGIGVENWTKGAFEDPLADRRDHESVSLEELQTLNGGLERPLLIQRFLRTDRAIESVVADEYCEGEDCISVVLIRIRDGGLRQLQRAILMLHRPRPVRFFLLGDFPENLLGY